MEPEEEIEQRDFRFLPQENVNKLNLSEEDVTCTVLSTFSYIKIIYELCIMKTYNIKKLNVSKDLRDIL